MPASVSEEEGGGQRDGTPPTVKCGHHGVSTYVRADTSLGVSRTGVTLDMHGVLLQQTTRDKCTRGTVPTATRGQHERCQIWRPTTFKSSHHQGHYWQSSTVGQLVKHGEGVTDGVSSGDASCGRVTSTWGQRLSI